MGIKDEKHKFVPHANPKVYRTCVKCGANQNHPVHQPPFPELPPYIPPKKVKVYEQ